MKSKHLFGGLILSTFMALGAVVAFNNAKEEKTEAAGTRTLYCKNEQGWWKAADAAVGAHYWGGTDETNWPGIRMTAVAGQTDLWSIEIPDDNTFIIFTRVNPSGDVADWGAKTDDLTIPNDGKNMFIITQSDPAWSGDEKISAGYWDTYVAPSVYHDVNKYEVVDGGSPKSLGAPESVVEGTSYSVPALPYKEGYTCGGWFTNAACTVAYTGSTINADLNLYVKYTSHAAYTGTIHVDLRDSGWAEAGANYAILFMDKTTYSSEIVAWSPYLTGTASGEHLVSISYSLPFNPLKMTIVRYNATYSQPSWNSNKWPTDGSLWGQTEDIDVASMVRIGSTQSGKNPSWSGYPLVMGGTSSWSELASLNSVKSNGSHNAEYYSTSVSLTAGQEFKIVVPPGEGGDYYGYYTVHNTIKGAFDGGKGDNIQVKTTGVYAFYFDSITNNVYITTVPIAEADEWAQYFLNNVGCDATGRNAPTGWSACASRYSTISSEAKDIVYGATAKEDGEYVEQAVARYDAALRSHPSLTKFITNGAGSASRGVAYIPTNVIIDSSNSGAIIGVLVTITVSIAAIGGYFFLRKKKED